MRTSFDRKAFGGERHRVLAARVSILENQVEGGRHEVHLEKRFTSQGDSRLEISQEGPSLE